MAVKLAPGTVLQWHDESLNLHWTGRVVVCLCKRHTWQQDVMDSGPGRECGHDRCGYGAPTDDACPWPNHVIWENGLTESHEGSDVR